MIQKLMILTGGFIFLFSAILFSQIVLTEVMVDPFQNSVVKLQYDLSAIRLWAETSFGTEGKKVTIWTSVINRGESSVPNFAITFFEDKDENGTLDCGEVIASLDHKVSLAPGASSDLSVLWDNPESGLKVLGVWIDAEGEERVDNNLLISRVPIGASPGDLVINEILFNPWPGQPEWIELYCPDVSGVDLRGWKISDSDTSRVIDIVKNRFPVSESGYVVVAQDSLVLNDPPGDLLITIPVKFPRLNNDQDALFIYDPLGSLIDHVCYQGSWVDKKGVSLERINPKLSSGDSANWSTCVAFEGMTPGRKNSIYTEVLPSRAVLSVSPNPFSPDEDGYDDVAIISYSLPWYTSRANLGVYDLRGRKIRSLLGASSIGSSGAVIWDGKDDTGRSARLGIYILYLEGLNANQGEVVSVKTTVVLARKL